MNVKDVLKSTLTEDDIQQAKQVLQMRLHPGWNVLVEFWSLQREAIINQGKKGSKTNEFNRAHLWGVLEGFDMACTMAERIERRSDHEEETEKLLNEGKHVAGS